MTEYEPVIGLEVHAELLTRSKMFCGCAVVDATTAEPNTSVCEICTGMPGTLPVINQRAVEFAIRVGLALECSIAETSVFARKNYFYPDLPKGFQISQYELPLASNGLLRVPPNPREPDQGEFDVRIRRVHLEEDTGKLNHDEQHSYVDYNRSGVPLLEIVSEPDLHSVEAARRYALALRTLLQYLEVNSGDMQKGVIRFEANVSVRPAGSSKLGTRTEIKNLNSFRSLTRSIAYEIERQSELLRGGGEVVQDTVGWDEAREVTVSQRSKEEAHDYRYFPEPDLPRLQVDPSWVDQIQAGIPELPGAKRRRFIAEYGLRPDSADVLIADRAVAQYYEAAVAAATVAAPDAVANWLSSNLFGLLHEANLRLSDSPVSAEALGELVDLVESGRINAVSGKEVLEHLVRQGGSPTAVVEQRGLAQLTDATEIADVVEAVLRDNPQQVADYLAGKSTLIEWFFGQVMRRTKGRADPAVTRKTLEAALAEKRQPAK